MCVCPGQKRSELKGEELTQVCLKQISVLHLPGSLVKTFPGSE